MLILLFLLISSSQACELLWFDNTHFLYECDQLQPKCMRLRNNGNKMILMCSEQIINNITPIEPTINATTTETISLPTTTAATSTTTTIAPTTATSTTTTIAPTTATSTTTTMIPTTIAATTTTIAPTTATSTTTTIAPTTATPTIAATSSPKLPTTTSAPILKTSYLRNQVDINQEPQKKDNTGFIVAIVSLSLITVGFIVYTLYQKKIKMRKSIMPKIDQENKKIQQSIEKKQIIKRVREEMKKANITTNRVPTLDKTAMKINEVKPSKIAKLKTQLPKRPKRPSELERMTIEDWRKLNHNVKGQQADKKVIQMMQRNKVVNNSNFK